MKTIAVAGASGFIGTHLIEALLNSTNYKILALSRSNKTSSHPRVEWKACDLFSVLDIEKAILGAQELIYLVHSMQPSAHLDQASFRDYDLILADNFGRAAKHLGISRIYYLGGLIPEKTKLSAHLESRLEVEYALSQNIEDYTFLRAGLILGQEGSSFNILLNLVKRLPILVCPLWSKNKSSPIHVDQVIKTFIEVLETKGHEKKIYDLASKDCKSYCEILKITADALELKRKFFHLPLNLIYLSRPWVKIFSGAPKRLVYPLLSSLKHGLEPRETSRYTPKSFDPITVGEAINKAVEESRGKKYKFTKRATERKTVRSVQRAPLPSGMNAEDIALTYMKWLPRFLFPFIIVTIKDHWVYFSFLHFRLKLLILKWSPLRSTKDRQLFYIKGGLLAAKQDRGRLEFREVLNSSKTLSAIHDFQPALPWYIYRYSQAVVHLIVMTFFGKYLAKKSAPENKEVIKGLKNEN